MRIIIVGKGGSGKDHLKSTFIKRGFKPAISFTTRPKRINEQDGIDYNFISKEDFDGRLKTNTLQEFDEFNGWFYGTSNFEWNDKQVFIKTPRGVAKIDKEDRKSCFIIYLDIDYDTRRKRLSKRQDADSVHRRLNADESDFKDFKDFDLRITNNDF